MSSQNTWRVDLASGITATLTGGTVDAVQSGSWNVGQSGTWTVEQGGSWSVSISGGTVAATQSGSWAVDQSGSWVVSISGSVDTELPAPVAYADGLSKPTAPSVISWPMMWDGATAYMARGDSTNGLDVDVTRVSGTVAVTQSGSWTVAGTGVFSVSQSGTWTVNQGGSWSVAQSGTWTVQPGNTPNTTPWLVSTKTNLTPSSPSAATVGTGSGSAVASNANRKGLVLVNTSTNRISLAFGTTAVLDSGITLYPGGVFEMNEHTFTTAAVNAIASGASSNLSIQEFS